MKKGKIITAFMVLVLVMTMGFTLVYAAADEPAPIQDSYEIDGVTYLKIDSDAFRTSPAQYFLDMMRTSTSKIKINPDDSFNTYWSCVGDMWMYIGAGLLKSVDRLSATYYLRGRAMEEGIARGSATYTGSGQSARGVRVLRANNLGDYAKAIMNYYSTADAERAVYSEIFNNADLQSGKGYFKDDSTDGIVLAGAAYAETVGTNNSKVGMAVYFSDFKVIPLLPEDKGSNYIRQKTKNVTENDTLIASNVKNMTASNVTASQTVSRSATDTLSSSISGSQSYTHSKSVEISVEKGFEAIGFKIGGKVAASTSEAVSSGWSESKSASVSDSVTQSVSVTLAPHTNVMLNQKNTTEEWYTAYNCPVALQYVATIVLYNNDGSVLRSYQFGPDGREDLYNRAVLNQKLNDRDGAEWSYFYNYDLPITLAAIQNASTIVPMSSTGGAFTETVETMETEVENILPLYPLTKVKVRAPNVSYISDETYSYGSYNYLNTEMYVGDFSYTNYMALDAFNIYNVEYYGFSKDYGHWVVADKDGNELTGDDAPVVIEKDPVSKNTMYKAVKPGECYIKFIIDEGLYTSAEDPDYYTTNDDLAQTAAVRIIVKDKPFEGSISISGSFKGYVNEEPCQIDEEGKLSADICDKTGKEIVKPYVWEAKELPSKGIILDGNMISFTKTGTFHVRAVTGDKYSDWVEIKVIDPSAEVAVTKKNNPLKISPKTATVKYSKLKKKTQSLTVTKVIKFTKKGQGKMTYTLSSAKKGSKSFKKYFKINKTTGKVTIKKNSKMKKGTYKVKVKVKAAGNANYKPSALKTVTFTVKVK